MKKFLSLLLCLLMLLSVVTACGNNSNADANETPDNSVATNSNVDWAAKAQAAMGVTPVSFSGPTEGTGPVPPGKKIALVSANAALQGCVVRCIPLRPFVISWAGPISSMTVPATLLSRTR